MVWSAKRVKTAIALGTVVVGLLDPSTLLRAQGAATTSTESAASRLERDVPALMKKGGVPGMSIALIRGGSTTWVHSFGVKDTKTGDPVTTETVFEAASVSKPVFAYGVLKLVDQGKLGLDVPLTTYLTKPYTDGGEGLGKITARIVLSHRTGVDQTDYSQSISLLGSGSVTRVKAISTCNA